MVGSPTIGTTPNGYWAIYSDDHGNSWSATTKIVNSGSTYWAGTIRADGDNVWAEANVGAGNRGHLYYSYNGGSSWSDVDIGLGGYHTFIQHNPLAAGRIYYTISLEDIIKRLDSGSVTATAGYCDNGHNVICGLTLMMSTIKGQSTTVLTYWSQLMGGITYSTVSTLSKNVHGIAEYSGCRQSNAG